MRKSKATCTEGSVKEGFRDAAGDSECKSEGGINCKLNRGEGAGCQRYCFREVVEAGDGKGKDNAKRQDVCGLEAANFRQGAITKGLGSMRTIDKPYLDLCTWSEGHSGYEQVRRPQMAKRTGQSRD